MIKKLFIAALIIVSAGCSDKLSVNTFNGTYAGEFYYVEPGKPLENTVSAPASVTFAAETFTSQGSSDRIPAGGSGKFEILKNKLADFHDENIWTANFDWGLILNGKYNYEIKGDSLILTRYREPCPTCDMPSSLYQYRLKRSN
jgi:hypothetical protein